MSYEPKNIRNVALLGHGNSGKTTLAESMLFMTGALDRQGKVTDGNTVCDYDPEEVKRQITISTAVAPVEFGGCKINVLDCPGYFDFAGEVAGAIRAVEAGIMGMEMFGAGHQFYGGDGIITKGVENTIRNIGRLARDGMTETDKQIIKIMLQ